MSNGEGRYARIPWLDGWRGIACWLMIIYHLLFDFFMLGWMGYDVIESWPMVLFEKTIAYSFILCAGISSCLTRSNIKRGLITLAAGAVVTAVSYAFGAPIKFGILQFMGVAMLIYAAAAKLIAKVPLKISPFLWIGLFIAAELLTKAIRVETHLLFWLGFFYEGFVSFDYFPLLPYFFLFLFGNWIAVRMAAGSERPAILDKKAPGILTWPGRHSLLIYLLHQPVLLGGCLAVYYLINR